jgi:hypothetical protein
MLPCKAVFGSRLRANQAFQFVDKQSLSSDERKVLACFEDDASLYGILKPSDGMLGLIKAISPDVAQLWCELRRPQKLPQWARSQLGLQCQPAISRLVYDSILEIEAGSEFFSGPEACDLLAKGPASMAGTGVISALSRQALEYGEALVLDAAQLLSARLYFFNRVPASPKWTHQFPDSQAVAEQLGLRAPRFSGTQRRLWPVTDLPESKSAWFSWTSSERQASRSGYKLYFSPACESMCEALQKAIEVAAETKASGFKVGKDVYGLLRPDKFVVYFACFSDLAEAARRFEQELGGFRAQGVPFTAALTSNGLLSWGIDPVDEPQPPNSQAESWRVWLTNRLAAALIQAKHARLRRLAPWQFAMARLQLEGVDARNWAPQPGFATRNGNHGEE